MRELDLWTAGAFVIILAWSLFGVLAFSHSYVMFLPLAESLKYDDSGNTLIGAALVALSSSYVAAVLIRIVWPICTWLIRILRVVGASTPPA